MSENPTNTLETHDADKAEKIDAQPELTPEKKPVLAIVIGVALVVLIIQLANLTNLLQHEIKPILNSTTDTVNTLKGTVRFLSDNVSEPVIKLNESLASIKKLVDIFRLKR